MFIKLKFVLVPIKKDNSILINKNNFICKSTQTTDSLWQNESCMKSKVATDELKTQDKVQCISDTVKENIDFKAEWYEKYYIDDKTILIPSYLPPYEKMLILNFNKFK